MPICEQLVLGFHGVGITVIVDENGMSIEARRLVVVREVVDQLLDPHRIGVRQIAVLEQAPHIGVRGRVDIDREGRDRLFRRDLQPVLLERLERVAFDIERLRLRARCRPTCRVVADGAAWRMVMRPIAGSGAGAASIIGLARRRFRRQRAGKTRLGAPCLASVSTEPPASPARPDLTASRRRCWS